MKVDVAIVGAGIMGCTMARALARYRLDVCVLESSFDVATGATKANSGIIHTGFHPRGGSLKGTSCVRGNAMYQEIVEDLRVPFIRTGALYVAFGPEGLAHIRKKRERASQNGAGTLEVVSGDEAREMEPRLSSRVISALVAPSTGIISPFELTLATARNAVANGVRFCFGFEVDRVERVNGKWVLHSNDGPTVEASCVVNMAGGNAALLDAQVHPVDVVVRPRRGQYIVFDKQSDEFNGLGPIRHVLFQAQETNEGGTLLAPTVEGNILAGPTSENIGSFDWNATTPEGLAHVRDVARKIVPDLDFGKVITQFSGVRANIVDVEKERKDFVVRVSAPGFISALGIKNPGITSAPALVEIAVDMLSQEGLPLELDVNFDPCSQGCHVDPFLRCDVETQSRLLKQDSRYGHVLCRCEQITEGDVRACLREPIAPSTIDGLKRRLRCGMGRCQGSFCFPRIVDVMADELGVKPADIAKGDHGGHIVRKAVK